MNIAYVLMRNLIYLVSPDAYEYIQHYLYLIKKTVQNFVFSQWYERDKTRFIHVRNFTEHNSPEDNDPTHHIPYFKRSIG